MHFVQGFIFYFVSSQNLRLPSCHRNSTVVHYVLVAMSFRLNSILSLPVLSVSEAAEWNVGSGRATVLPLLALSSAFGVDKIRNCRRRQPKRLVVEKEIDNVRKTKAKFAATAADLICGSRTGMRRSMVDGEEIYLQRDAIDIFTVCTWQPRESPRRLCMHTASSLSEAGTIELGPTAVLSLLMTMSSAGTFADKAQGILETFHTL